MSFPELAPDRVLSDLARFRLIDVRQPHEIEGPLGHLEGAEHLPLAAVAEHAADLAGPRPLLLICRSGKRSAKACETLQQLGIQNVTNLAGGMIAWNQSGLPIMRAEPRTLEELLTCMVHWVAQVTATTSEDAINRIDRLLSKAGAEFEAATYSALDFALDALLLELGEPIPPADLKLAIDVFRKDLAVL